MKTIRFEFTCSRHIPLYAKLCNNYLKQTNFEVDIKIGCIDFTYFIEATGIQADLESLADEIARDFLISSWLVKADIKLVDSCLGEKKALNELQLDLDFCQQCQPLFGDNQSPKFGDTSIACPLCHGEMLNHNHYDLKSLHEMAKNINKTPIVLNTARGQVTLQLTPSSHVLVCNPNNINAHFQLNDQHVLALSSIEKPYLKVQAIHEHASLNNPFYMLGFASDRILVVISEILRLACIDYVYIEQDYPSLHLAWVDSGWSEIASFTKKQFAFKNKPLVNKASNGGYNASYNNGIITTELVDAHQEPTNAALCSLYAANQEHEIEGNSAIIYLSSKTKNQILYLDKNKHELFLELPTLPNNGYEIYHILEQSKQKELFNKFKEKFPNDYESLLDLKFTNRTDNIQTLWAIAAVLLGFSNKSLKTQDPDFLSATFQARSFLHSGNNAPRIDFPLTKGEAWRGINWCRTFASIVSFRLAESGDASDLNKIAYGFMDSFADYLANWIEHIDQNIGIKAVTLAGDGFAHEVLNYRLTLRLSRNIPIVVNRELDLDGNNLAVGALYLKR